MIYKIDESTGSFSLYQTLQTRGAYDLEYFSIGNKHFLAFAYYYDGTHQLDSTIYQWNGKLFDTFQKVPTNGATHFTYFKMHEEHYLAVANHYDGSSFSTNSVIYKWSSGKFNKFQDIPTEGAMGCTAFVINNDTFISFPDTIIILFSLLCSNGQEKTLPNSSLFKRMERSLSSLLTLMATRSSPLQTISLEVNTTSTPSFTSGMGTSSSCSSPFLLVGLSPGIHLWSVLTRTWVCLTTKMTIRDMSPNQLCTRPLELILLSTKRF